MLLSFLTSNAALHSCLQDWFREILPRYDASQRPFAALSANAAAGAAAGALSLALVYPFEFATVRLAADVGGGAGDRQYGHGECRTLMLKFIKCDTAGCH